MLEFAEQCLDVARSVLSQNLNAINDDGTVSPVEGEGPRLDEPGHAALAIGEFYRATGETSLEGQDLVDLTARSITAQAFTEEEAENGLAYAALGLLSFGPSKERNLVWERLLDPTREKLDHRLLLRTDYDTHLQAFNIAKSVARYSMGLSKKDETGKLIDRFVERIAAKSSAGFHDDAAEGSGLGGVYDIYGILSFIFIRQALQLHANIHLRERKMPTLRTNAEKYIRMMPDVVRSDGMGWIIGRGTGAYGQMHCISIILQALRDDWIAEDQKGRYYGILRRLFQFFFMTYLDQENGYLVIRDPERTTWDYHTTRMANFDAARYLCQWSRLARAVGEMPDPAAQKARTGGRFVIFDKSSRKEQGLFIYRDAGSGLHVQLPLCSQGGSDASDSLAFPHSPGIFDWPAAQYMPVLVPELTFGDKVTVPSFYGKRCVTGLGLKNSFYFRYEQPDLITKEEKTVPQLGSVKVSWTFQKNRVQAEYIYTVKNTVQLDRFRYQLVIAGPHSTYCQPNMLMLGQEGLRCTVLHDDFQAAWQETDVVTEEAAYKTYYGNIHYIQTLERDHPLTMRPGSQYRLIVAFEPDITSVEG